MDQGPPIDPDRWVDDHGDALFGYAMLRLRDADQAAEVVQEAFLEALKSRGSFQGRSSERTWLIAILKHRIIDHFRRNARRERGVGGDDPRGSDPEFFNGLGSWKAGVAQWPELPDDEVERAEFWEVFRDALARLPATYAEAFTLSELEEIPGPEVCKFLGISPTNLWARLHRARLILRREIDARWFGRGRGEK